MLTVKFPCSREKYLPEQSARQSAVSAEQSRAQGAESALSGRIGVLETDPTTKNYVDGQISAEQSARQSADSALSRTLRRN
jgi:hypothetical protein